MKKIYIIILIILYAQIGFTQQDSQYTQYMYNTVSVNPAYAGTRGTLSITALHRSQWAGLEGAPVTQTLSLNTPLRNERIGIGFSVVHDKIGPTQETYFDAVMSYTIPTSDKGDKLSFGLKAGGHLLNIDFMKLNQYVPQLVTADNIDHKFSPTIGAGIYYHNDHFYAGLSVPNFLETKHFDETSDANTETSFVAKERMNYYLITGYVFNLNENWVFKPAVLTKVVSGSPLQVDLSANFWYKQKLTLGAAYRWDAAWSAMAGFQLNDSLMLGFGYDKEITDLGNTSFNDGSFEAFLRFEFARKLDKIISPRFF
ncbi:type IX secretion system PorP/SprF family membrane protein [Tenacibaculum adriaticum]|uniref:Type IX secretion system PorP/SprF family membrane protein n=1 Tax=Tenacibaculum adriaticum TaxID=413713 RepID=A0A5S5DRF9_9FLAO|nr:type IX secretion system membrane protein PorP/SprF [Tenacibaculum adriaticum]TYP98345.1 type IX secretion system PorP/SprF family membrane protein [Tenacibaculum adriaticum]